MRQTKSHKTKKNEIAEEMLRRLNDFADALANGEKLSERFTVREVDIPDPRQYTQADVKRIRGRLSMSQAVFARALGVSPELVRSWESQKRPVGPLASRLLQMIEAEPAKFIRRITIVNAVHAGSVKAPGSLRRAK
jgi:putative transcriptional regulator